MGLYFRNTTNVNVQVVFSYENPACDGDKWSKKGWYHLTPGQEKLVWAGWAGHYRFLFYAESTDGGRWWSGNYFTQIPYRAFDWCWRTGSTDSRNLGLMLFDPPWTSMDHTIRLT